MRQGSPYRLRLRWNNRYCKGMVGKEEEAKIKALNILVEPLIYQTNSYKFLKSSIDKASKKLKTIKIENLAKISTKKSKTKMIDRVKISLKESSHDLSLFKFKSETIVTLILFEEKVVVKLSFKPCGIVMKMSHRRLQGDMLKWEYNRNLHFCHIIRLGMDFPMKLLGIQ